MLQYTRVILSCPCPRTRPQWSSLTIVQSGKVYIEHVLEPEGLRQVGIAAVSRGEQTREVAVEDVLPGGDDSVHSKDPPLHTARMRGWRE